MTGTTVGTTATAAAVGELANFPRQRPARREALRRLPGDLLGHLQGRRTPLNDDAWAILSSDRTARALEARPALSRSRRPFEHGVLPDGPDAEHFQYLEPWVDRELVAFTSQPCYIDPDFGWVVSPGFDLVGSHLVTDHVGVPVPRMRNLLAARLGRAPVLELGEVLNLRDPCESNYYHALFDLLAGRLHLAGEAGVDADVPVLVGTALARMGCFDELAARSGLAERRLVVQGGRHVRSERIVVAKAARFASPESVERLWNALRVPVSDAASERRYFLHRPPARGRNVTNMDDVESVCRRYGFELMAPEQLPLEAQMEALSGARYVAGLYGSALTNIAWRRDAALSLLEIFPPVIRRPDGIFMALARALGFSYRCLGESLGQPYDVVFDDRAGLDTFKRHKQESFRLDPEMLDHSLRNLLETS